MKDRIERAYEVGELAINEIAPLQPQLPLIGDVAGNMVAKIAQGSRVGPPLQERLSECTKVLLVQMMRNAGTTVPQQNKPVRLHALAFPSTPNNRQRLVGLFNKMVTPTCMRTF